jgi:hypothetical protein
MQERGIMNLLEKEDKMTQDWTETSTGKRTGKKRKGRVEKRRKIKYVEQMIEGWSTDTSHDNTSGS